MNGTVLVAEDEAIARKNICQFLTDAGYQVHQACDGAEALAAVDATEFDVVLTDIQMPQADGLTVLRHVREVAPQTFTLIMTAFASVDTAAEALRLGAHDYVLKPIVLEELLRKIHTLLEYRDQAWELQHLRRAVTRAADPAELLIGRSQVIQDLRELIGKVADAPSTTLITGESGVGKEVVARIIHQRSPRAAKIFLPVNCSAIPESLVESQLFGHVKGAFTGAVTSQDGLFQRARGGTIFLDEIGELPLGVQVKLLRVLEGKEVLPVGAVTPVPVDVRILAATNRDLQQEIAANRFREDLYYRLNVITILIRPLRERCEDIPLLTEHFVQVHNRELKTAYKGVNGAALRVLVSLPWKGNVRELDNVIERAMILGNGEWITPAELPPTDRPLATPEPLRKGRFKESIAAYEQRLIESALQETGGEHTRAARLLGMSRSSLYRKLTQFGMLREDAKNAAASS